MLRVIRRLGKLVSRRALTDEVARRVGQMVQTPAGRIGVAKALHDEGYISARQALYVLDGPPPEDNPASPPGPSSAGRKKSS